MNPNRIQKMADALLEGLVTEEQVDEIFQAIIQLVGEIQKKQSLAQEDVNGAISDFSEQIKSIYSNTETSLKEQGQAIESVRQLITSLQKEVKDIVTLDGEDADEDEIVSRVLDVVEERISELQSLIPQVKEKTAEELLALLGNVPMTQIDGLEGKLQEMNGDMLKLSNELVNKVPRIEVFSEGTKVGSAHRVNFTGATVTMNNGMIEVESGGLPSQTGNNGKFLTTDGTDASWATLAGGGDMAAAVYDPANGAEQVAFASELASYVPYTGGDADIEFDGSAERSIAGGTAGAGFDGADIVLVGGYGGTGNTDGGDAKLIGGLKSGTGIGGDVIFQVGGGGVVKITDTDVAASVTLDMSNISTDRAYTLPNDDGTLALLSDVTAKPTISSGAGAPGSTPTKVGDIYIDTTGDDAYIAVGTASSADWEKTNDGAGGGISDGDKGDITVSASGATWTIDNDVVTYAKMQNVSATDKVLGRSTAGAGDVEEISTTGSGNVVRATSPTLVTPALGTPSSGTLTNCTGLPVAGITASTSTALGVGSINLGHASDTTIARVSAGVISVEGVTVPTLSSTSTLTNKTLTSPVLTTPTLGTPASGTLTNCTGLPLAGVVDSTTEALGVGSLEVGHASDTTITRVSAGVIAVEGVNVSLSGHTHSLANVTDVTASAAEVNVLDGIPGTLTATELGYVDGVTSAIQTQLDAKAPLASPTFTGTVTLPIGLTGVIRTDSGVVSVDTDVTDIVAAASDSAAGKVELAIASEVNTGTDTGRAITPDALAGSNLGTKSVMLDVIAAATALTTGDDKYSFILPSSVNGMDLIAAHARVFTAGTTGTTDIQLHNVTDAVDMLSTKITIDSTETTSYSAATAPVINGSNDSVATGDIIRVDIDAISTTPPSGLQVILEFRLP